MADQEHLASGEAIGYLGFCVMGSPATSFYQ